MPRFMVISAPLRRDFKDGAVWYVLDTMLARHVADFDSLEAAEQDAHWRNLATDALQTLLIHQPKHGGR